MKRILIRVHRGNEPLADVWNACSLREPHCEGEFVTDVPRSSVFYGKIRPGDIITMIGDKKVEYSTVPEDFKEYLKQNVIKVCVFRHQDLSTQSIFDLYEMKVVHGPMVGENDRQTKVKYRYSSRSKQSNKQVAAGDQNCKRPTLQTASSQDRNDESPRSSSENEFDQDFQESMHESHEDDDEEDSESEKPPLPSSFEITDLERQESKKYRELANDVLNRVPDEDLKQMTALDIGEYVLFSCRSMFQDNIVVSGDTALNPRFDISDEELKLILEEVWTKGLTLQQCTSIFGKLMADRPDFSSKNLIKLLGREQRFFRIVFHFLMYFVHCKHTNRVNSHLSCLQEVRGKETFLILLENLEATIIHNQIERGIYLSNARTVFNALDENTGPIGLKKDPEVWLLEIDSVGLAKGLRKSFREELKRGDFTISEYLDNKNTGCIRGWLKEWKDTMILIGLGTYLESRVRTKH